MSSSNSHSTVELAQPILKHGAGHPCFLVVGVGDVYTGVERFTEAPRSFTFTDDEWSQLVCPCCVGTQCDGYSLLLFFFCH